MNKQSTFEQFEESTTNHANPFDFDEFGPTMYRPLPEAEMAARFESGGAVIDRRTIPQSGLSLSDITDWPSINRERENIAERDYFEEMMKKIQPHQNDDEPADYAGGTARVVVDGGVEMADCARCGGEHKVIEDADGYGLMNCNGATIATRPPEAEDTEEVATDGGVAKADFDTLDEIGRGSVLSLDSRKGEFLIVNRKEVPIGTVQSLDVVDTHGSEFRLNVVALGGERYFDVERGHETSVVKNTANIDDVRDFEVLRQDQEWLEEYFETTIPHFTR